MANSQAEKLSYPNEMLQIIRRGLPFSPKKKRIIIIGAGMAGLVAGSLLKQAGHMVTILEGNHRAGGRVHTVRAPFASGNYLDVGAMRIPTDHALVMGYIKKFNLSIQKFYNSTPLDFLLVNGKRVYQKHYKENPEILDYPLLPWEQGKSAKELFLLAVQPFLDLYKNSPPEEQETLKKQYSRYSMEDFLRHNPLGPSLSNAAVRKIKVLLGIEGFPEFSFVDILTDITYPIFNGETEFIQIKDGNDHLPYAFMPHLRENISFGEKVEKIIQQKDYTLVETKNIQTGQQKSWSGDLVLSTIPFPVFQFIQVMPHSSISVQKWHAIQEVANISAVKVGIEFKTRFWEKYPIGHIVSDYPMRFTYLPSHDFGKPGPGVLLASYSWGQNALLFNCLSKEETIREILETLAIIYGPVVYGQYKSSVVYNWSRNPFSAGCFTLFTPGQSRHLEDVIPRPEGRLHFAGEHTSSFHGWIEGAIESGIRAAHEINARLDV